MIWGRSVCNVHGALYHYGGPQSASDIGTPGTPQIASVIGTGGLKIGGSPYHFYTGHGLQLSHPVHCNSPSVVSVVSLREHWQLLPKLLVASIHLSRRGALTQRSSSPQWWSAYSTQLYLCLEAEE